MTASYNSKAGIASYLSRGLPGLEELRRARGAAWYERKEAGLQQFYVLGRWVLDTCGNFGRIHEVAFKPGDMSMLGKVPDVMTTEEAQLFLRGESLSWGFGPSFPAPDARCPECCKGWALENATDFATRSDSERPTFFHKACNRRRIAIAERAATESAFAEAGYPRVNLISQPNQYCPCDVCPPWYLAQVGELPPITIGWRKRVIVIDWEASGMPLPELFAGEKVTKSDTMIHAWGYAKASEYLGKLLPVLGGQLPGERKAEP